MRPTQSSLDLSLFDQCFYIDLVTLEAYRVDADTDNLSDDEMAQHWDEVEKADRAEIFQFVQEKVWTCVDTNNITLPPADAIWVRKWKWTTDKTTGKTIRKVKSRLCARGYLDAQGDQLTTRATTASRLSQRLLVALSSILGFTLETWDVSGAFLKGFPFKEMEAEMKRKGLYSPQREISIRPPANVWRHLREIPSFNIKVPPKPDMVVRAPIQQTDVRT